MVDAGQVVSSSEGLNRRSFLGKVAVPVVLATASTIPGVGTALAEGLHERSKVYSEVDRISTFVKTIAIDKYGFFPKTIDSDKFARLAVEEGLSFKDVEGMLKKMKYYTTSEDVPVEERLNKGNLTKLSELAEISPRVIEAILETFEGLNDNGKYIRGILPHEIDDLVFEAKRIYSNDSISDKFARFRDGPLDEIEKASLSKRGKLQRYDLIVKQLVSKA